MPLRAGPLVYIKESRGCRRISAGRGFFMAESAADAIAIIPARFASKRLPGKALVDLAGRPMIERVYRRATRATTTLRTIVATDDDRIRKAMESAGGEVVMTAADHESGSDRIAEVARALECAIVVNVQ